MRDQTPTRLRRLAAAAAITLALALALGAGGARAEEDDDENVPLDTKLWRQFMKDIGLQRDGDRTIDYRERAPLVVPPSRNLPPPLSEDELTAKTPAWPKDPDVKRRKDQAAAEKARLKGTNSVEEQMRVLRPDELDKPGRAAKGSDAKGAGKTAEESSRPMMPSELGTNTKKIFGSIISSFTPAQPEAEPFTGEPTRDSMTAPPAGYQTPSPNYPYGIGTQDRRGKASTLEERMEPKR
ncbi:MAG TPA: hypothetical protein VE801_10520 [Xanthobacteraceae bacterium]|jgi:hypothetical protein|nr:hypothetical protein [Xanthobacteraceae bacterium]